MAQFLYVGSRRKGPSSWSPPPAGDFGIGIHRYDPATGALTELERVAPDLSVGFLLHDPRRGVLYALHEAMTLPDRKRGGGGMIAAFRIGQNGGLTEIARSPSFGSLPCHATLSPDRRYLLVVHHTGHTPTTRTVETPDGYRIMLDYDEAATVLFPLDDAGRLGPPSHILPHHGQGTLPDQTHSQLHCIRALPGSDLYVVCDKGGDCITLLRQNGDRLTYLRDIPAPPGSSPRTCVLHPVLPVFYVDFETAPLLHAYRWTPGGEVDQIARLMPWSEAAGSVPHLMPSDLAVNASGDRLYMLLRGPEALTTFRLDAQGIPQPMDSQAMQVENPRAVTLSPDGARLLVAAVVSQEVRSWPLDRHGLPHGAGISHNFSHAGCMVFA